MDAKEFESKIKEFALENAVKFDGTANKSAIIGKLFTLDKDIKAKLKEVMPLIDKIIKEVNTISVDNQKKELLKLNPNYEEEQKEKKKENKEHIKEEKEEMKDLDDVDLKKGVIMRFAPSPSGPMHIGHAITGGLSSLYVKKYGGKFILRIEDTNSDNIDTDSYELLPKDADWIFGNVSEVWIQSDRMQIYYDYVEKLIELNACYVCLCSQEKFKEFSDNALECPCRNNTVLQNKINWKKMFDKENGFKEGEAVVRFKSDMHDKNPAMRDFPLVRINDSNHPRQGYKYRVWPLMNLCVTVDDIEAGMTHIIRAKEHADNAKRQEKIYSVLGLKDDFPKTYFLGRYNFEGLEISCSKTKEKIKKGQFWGWDDIRLPFLQALKRKGYRPETFLKYTKLTGISLVDKTIPADEFFKIINAFNKELIDPIAKRFFFLYDYEKIKIEKAPTQKIELKIHPDHDDYGFRIFECQEQYYIQKSDLSDFKENGLYRLMDCLNFVKKDNKFIYHSKEYETFRDYTGYKKIIHYLPVSENLFDAEILMNDATTINGLVEAGIKNIKVDEVVQFERFGFCRLDGIEINKKTEKPVYKFWFTHK